MEDQYNFKKESPETCKHEKFYTEARITRLTDDEKSEEIVEYRADIKICCSVCGQAFEFIGVPEGYTPSHPTVSVDYTELRLPIRPSKQPPAKNGSKIVN